MGKSRSVSVVVSHPVEGNFDPILRPDGTYRVVATTTGATFTLDGRIVQSSLSPILASEMAALKAARPGKAVTLTLSRQGPNGSRRIGSSWASIGATNAPKGRKARATAPATAPATE
jgi:hypothetical protein